MKSSSCERKIKVFLKEDLEEKNKKARQDAEFDTAAESSSLVHSFKELQKVKNKYLIRNQFYLLYFYFNPIHNLNSHY